MVQVVRMKIVVMLIMLLDGSSRDNEDGCNVDTLLDGSSRENEDGCNVEGSSVVRNRRSSPRVVGHLGFKC